MIDPSELEPAQHVMPAPTGGWSATDVSEDELVDDKHIDSDPNSVVIQWRSPA